MPKIGRRPVLAAEVVFLWAFLERLYFAWVLMHINLFPNLCLIAWKSLVGWSNSQERDRIHCSNMSQQNDIDTLRNKSNLNHDKDYYHQAHLHMYTESGSRPPNLYEPNWRSKTCQGAKSTSSAVCLHTLLALVTTIAFLLDAALGGGLGAGLTHNQR